MQHDLKGSMVLSVQRVLINPLSLMSKGDEKKRGVSIRQTEEEYCHQCQRGILLEILSLMAKKAVDAESGKEQQKKTTGNIYSKGIGRGRTAEVQRRQRQKQ